LSDPKSETSCDSHVSASVSVDSLEYLNVLPAMAVHPADHTRKAKEMLAEWKADENVDQEWIEDKLLDLKLFVFEYKQDIDTKLFLEEKKGDKSNNKHTRNEEGRMDVV
jgi:hypothetical protein